MNQLATERKIASIIGNLRLASDIYHSIDTALINSFVHVAGSKNVWAIFQHSLGEAIRDIENHPRGKLFWRLIKYGPLNPKVPKTLISDNETHLSDPECGSCVEFIYSYMINWFKGEIAELLAIEQCIKLLQQLQQNGKLPLDIQIYFGDTVKERRRVSLKSQPSIVDWGDYAKGADGLLVEQVHHAENSGLLKIHGIIEVKSMTRSVKKILEQINKHIIRLSGGIKLGNNEWKSDNLLINNFKSSENNEDSVFRIMAMPSTWKLSRELLSIQKIDKKVLEFPEQYDPPEQTQISEVHPNCWKITLAWSQEALNQAAYEMTFWYMSQVGKYVFSKDNQPKEWEEMTPEEAGYNAIKMMLYYIPLRYITKRQDRLATRLYNVYCFGYPLGADSKEMLWPEDVRGNNYIE